MLKLTKMKLTEYQKEGKQNASIANPGITCKIRRGVCVV